MRVLVHVPGKQPTALVCSRLTAAIAAQALKKQAAPAPPLTKEALCGLMIAIRRCRRRLRPLHLMELRSTNGAAKDSTEVIIDL